MAHKLSRIDIFNFKSIIDHSFILSDYTPLIGYNNAGKTNLIKAIKWLLRKSSLASDHFYDSEQEIVIIGKIEGITEELLQTLSANQRNSLLPFVYNESIEIKRVQFRPGDSATNIRLFIKNPNAENDEDIWRVNPNGIDQAIANLFPEPIHIGAMENAEEDVSKYKTSSTIGKLLAEIIAPIEEQHGANVREALQGFHSLLDAEGPNRAQELIDFDRAMNNKIDDFFPDVSVKLHIPTPELKEVFNKGTIKVYEGNGIGRDVASYGHGAQRSIQMALIRHLAEIKRVANNQTTRTLLLIDEPELYLHPQAIEVIKDALKELSKEGYQIIFSTHTAMMLTHEDVGNALLIRKSNDAGTYCRSTLRNAIERIEQDAPSQLQLLFSLGNASQILFSERVILTEGRTEEKVLPTVVYSILGKTLGYHKCALIKQGGVANTRKCLLVLHAMNVPAKAIVDLDYAFRNSIVDGFLNEDDTDIFAAKALMLQLSQQNNFNLAIDGFPAKGGDLTPSQAFSLFATNLQGQEIVSRLHNKLKAFNIWVWKRGAIEDHLGLEGKSEAVWATFCNRCKNEELIDFILDHAEIVNCINWVIN
ncbi:hypothetical protein GCM10023149_20770 [Mucilaginibacter gynuensis]|uniref:ATP-dependent endonuclease of OLD family n=1 Tax=Mucilaginibacter gynuensis TaxID=1302236 RepID=A0ABP8GBG6_9SPHI